MKVISLWLVVALLALLFTAAFAQDDGTPLPPDGTEPPTPPAPVLVPFAKLAFSMKIPKDHFIINWESTLNGLKDACGVSNLSMIKDGAGEEKFVFYTPIVGEGATFASFQAACEAQINKKKDDLKSYGQVEFKGMTQVDLEEVCTTTCGTEVCPPCPLLHECTDDAQCGPDSRCADSQEHKDQKWCISSSAFFFTSTIAVVLAVSTLLF